MDSLDQLEQSLSYTFRQRQWLEQALTHSSYAHEQKMRIEDNERLEFLGDSILGLLISDALFRRHPSLDEGQLSKSKGFLVSAANLVQYSQQLGLGEHLRLGRGEELSGGRTKQALLVDGLEAVIGAVYVDGGFRSVRRVVARLFGRQIEAIAHTAGRASDFKSALQERLQSDGRASADYRLLEETGPEHRKRFTVEVRIDGRPAAEGIGLTKKAAEQAAAMRAIEALGSDREESENS